MQASEISFGPASSTEHRGESLRGKRGAGPVERDDDAVTVWVAVDPVASSASSPDEAVSLARLDQSLRGKRAQFRVHGVTTLTAGASMSCRPGGITSPAETKSAT